MAQSWEDFMNVFNKGITGTNLASETVTVPGRKKRKSWEPGEITKLINPEFAPEPEDDVDPDYALGDFEEYYRDPDSGTRYEGSAKGIRDKIVAERMAENEASGKYNKKGLFKKLRGSMERSLDRRYGGDWDPGIDDFGSIRDDVSEGIERNRKRHDTNEVLRLAEEGRVRQEEGKDETFERLKELLEISSGGKGLIKGAYPQSLEAPEDDYTDLLNRYNDLKKSFRGDYPEGHNELAGAARIEDHTTGDYSNQTEIDADAIKDQPGSMTSRLTTKGSNGQDYKLLSDDKYRTWKGENGILYNDYGDTVGYMDKYGKPHYQEPDEGMEGWGMNVGPIQNKHIQDKKSLHYPLGGKTQIKGADPGSNMPQAEGGVLGRLGKALEPQMETLLYEYPPEVQKLIQEAQNEGHSLETIMKAMRSGPYASLGIDPKAVVNNPKGAQEKTHPGSTMLYDESVKDFNDKSVYSKDNPRPIGATPDEELMSHPLMQMDLGGADAMNKNMKELGYSYWDRFKADAVGPGSWGWRGRPFKPKPKSSDPDYDPLDEYFKHWRNN